MGSRLLIAALLAVLALTGVWFLLGTDRSTAQPYAGTTKSVEPEETADDVAALTPEAGVASRQELPAEATPEALTEPEPEEVTQGPGDTYWGRLVDQETGRGVGRAWVEFHGRSGNRSSVQAASEKSVRVQSDSQGYFELAMAEMGRSVMGCEPAGYGSIVFQPGEGHATREQAQVLSLSRSASWSVIVLDAQDGPLAGVRLELYAPTFELARPEGHFVSGRSKGVQFSATTDGTGRAEFEGLPAEVPLSIEATWDERTFPQPDALVLEAGEVRAGELRIIGRASLGVRVVDQLGQPVARCKLWLLRNERGGVRPGERWALSPSRERDVVARTTTDAAGLASFEELTVGNWWVGVAPEPRDSQRSERIIAALLEGSSTKELEQAVVPLAIPFAVDPSTQHLELELATHRARFITGEVVGLDEAQKRVRVRATTDLYRAYLSADIDEEGRFALGPLMEGAYELRASARLGGRHAPGVIAHAGDRNVQLELAPGGNFSGRIIDASSGEPAAGGVVVWSPPPRFHLSLGFTSDGRSEFSQTGLAPSTYDVTARTPDGRVGTLRGIEVRPGSTREGLVVRVRPGGRLRIRYFGPATYANYSVFDAETVVAANGLHRGTSELEIVAATRLRVELDAGSAGVHEQVVLVQPGDTAEVVFDLR